jgi:hypothetical protein
MQSGTSRCSRNGPADRLAEVRVARTSGIVVLVLVIASGLFLRIVWVALAWRLVMMSDNDEQKSPMNGDLLKCSFCDKRQDQVEQLIAGPGGVAICTECVDLCNEIIADARAMGS